MNFKEFINYETNRPVLVNLDYIQVVHPRFDQAGDFDFCVLVTQGGHTIRVKESYMVIHHMLRS